MQLHLNSYGAYLHVKDAMFDVRKKQDDGSWSSKPVAAHKVKSIWMGRGTALSSDAVRLALQHNVDIVFLENDGMPMGRVWHSKLGSTTLIRKRQSEAALDDRGLRYVKDWLCAKLENQADFVRDLKKHRPQHGDFLADKVERIGQLREQIAGATGAVTSEVSASLQGWEGTAGRLYFETVSFVLPRPWQFAGRSNRPAKDVFNAFLNYAYGVLYARVEKTLMLAGLDPYSGFMHRDDYNHKSLVFDFIEPYRCWADKTVFTLFSGKKVNQGHAEAITGGFSLNKEGKVLLMEAYNEYLENDIIRYRGRNRTRATILLLEAHRVAQELLTGATGDDLPEPDIDIQQL
ncbi:MAG: CRISPR-associated endonuclease Cas1 [Saprospirales bacterium]|nr:CRISPR-associated endonuclease Cas1 [Saprospirales bacterium]